MGEITFDIIKNDEKVRAYITAGDAALRVLGYTEHSFPHVYKTAQTAAAILSDLGYGKRDAELAKIAGLLHDIGNMVNRNYHALTGGVLAESILSSPEYNMPYSEMTSIITAIGNHDEETGRPVNIISAALILADKSDVRRSRVTESDMDKILADIHDRVNYAVTNGNISACTDNDKNGAKKIVLNLSIDTSVCSVMDYFEIFLTRMLMCRRAAAYLEAEFDLIINNLKIM
ncbi:MAG: HD domain-containing protein [Oscillospiraceae bacterium]|nr:HD domain-containing protein [Oscillospiraceae bacterium]